VLINQELLRTFVITVEAPSFGEAARRRRVTKSAISQQIKALEGQLGMRLFERVGRRALPTETGRRLAAILATELAIIDEALEAASSAMREVKGTVRIGAPRPFARAWVRPRIADLIRRHEALSVRLTFDVPSELEPRLSDASLDLAVLTREPDLTTVEATLLTTERFDAYASPAYLAKHGEPKSHADLADHRFLAFDEDLAMHAPWWRATFGARASLSVRIACYAASVDELAGLAAESIGIAVLPDYIAAPYLEQKSLRRLTLAPRARPVTNALWLAWRRGAIETARVRAAKEALLRKETC
jgi:DNA-binding transcriptional LysR family regulator